MDYISALAIVLGLGVCVMFIVTILLSVVDIVLRIRRHK